MTGESQGSLLGLYRALDLTDRKGWLCGKVLADLGADVIKIEPPGGDVSRRMGPFYNNTPGRENSLLWFAFNASKRGITLNIETSEAREIFKLLVKRSDFVIESFTPGYMDTLDLSYSVLSEVNPRVILTSITPFGQTGPYKGYKTSDLVAMATGGLMYVTGDPDRAPVRISVPQAYSQAGAQAAMGTLIAHYYRELTGEGQQVDVSIQAALTKALVGELPMWEFLHILTHRLGPKYRRGETYQLTVWPCKDGQVGFRLLGGAYRKGIRPLVEWMKEEGMAGALADIQDWENVDIVNMSQEDIVAWEESVVDFFLKHTMAELHEASVKRGFYLLPSNTTKDIVASKQLSARYFWQEVNHPELGDNIIYPGPPYKFSDAKCQIRHRAPLIGEHNAEVYQKELGLSKQELISLKEGNVI
ncbi:CaiB/BaiF CoA transferase family protein [Chloroflexota bacterium]